jgi:hypothetical protein
MTATVLPPVPPAPAAPVGSHTHLPVLEFARTLIDTPRKKVRSKAIRLGVHSGFVANPHPDLALTPYRLFHAAAKADLMRVRSAEEVEERQEEMAFLCRRLLDWSQQPLRLAPGRSTKYKTRSGLAGMLGEGVALLFMDHLGFPFWDHAESVLRRAKGEQVEDDHDDALPGQPPLDTNAGTDDTPDFICEDRQGHFVITEAKAGFVRPRPGTRPDIKGALARGLVQTDSMCAKFGVTPHKSYVIGTYLREVGDTCSEIPLVAVVDPKFADVQNSGFPDDWVRRGNYAAWLLMMGFPRSAEALRLRSGSEGQRIALPVIRLAGRDFALSVFPCACDTGLASPLDSGRTVATQDVPADVVLLILRMMAAMNRPLRVVGIEVNTLHRIGRAAIFGPSAPLIDLPEIRSLVRFEEEWFSGSVLSDGTLFGQINGKVAHTISLSYMEFKL